VWNLREERGLLPCRALREADGHGFCEAKEVATKSSERARWASER